MMLSGEILFICKGVLITLTYAILSSIIGLIIGIIFGSILATTKIEYLRAPIKIYVSVFRGTPLLLQLYAFFFMIPYAIGIDLGNFGSCLLALSLNCGAYLTETIRGGINSVYDGQFEACKAMKIPYMLAVRDIIMPQALIACLPSIINEFITMIKETSLVSIVGQWDLMYRAKIIGAAHYSYIAPLVVAGLVYYILNVCISIFGGILEKRITNKFR